MKEIGGDYVAVQLAGLDRADTTEPIEARIRFADDRNNNWGEPPPKQDICSSEGPNLPVRTMRRDGDIHWNLSGLHWTPLTMRVFVKAR